MARTLCLYFKPVRQLYNYEGNLDLKPNSYVIVNTSYGEHLAKILSTSCNIKNVPEISILQGEILRPATKEEIEELKTYQKEEKEVKERISDYVKEFNLKMQIVTAKYSLDKKYLIVFFTSDKMVDFRELLYFLSRDYPQKIRLENIGDTKKYAVYYDGFGICGKPFCCAVGGFGEGTKAQIKNQGLAPNPINYLGCCNHLRCCLNFEDEVYKDLRSKLPAKGEFVTYEKEKYRVADLNILKQEIILEKQTQDGKERITITAKELYGKK